MSNIGKTTHSSQAIKLDGTFDFEKPLLGKITVLKYVEIEKSLIKDKL